MRPYSNSAFTSIFSGSTRLHISDPHDIADVVAQHRRRFRIDIRQPLMLISQIQRSGGTLICQLLDGHGQLHVHPGELHIGRPNKYEWPKLDLRCGPGELFDDLVERPALESTQFGYQKMSSAEGRFDPRYRERVLPFIFDVRLQKQLFLDYARTQPLTSQRTALDAYVTSYFNAWLDYQGLYRDPATVRYWVSFAARLLAKPGNFERFVDDYPDGKVIAVVRDPVSWFASARRHSSEYDDKDGAVELWIASYLTLLENVRTAPHTILLLKFEECVADCRLVMERIANFAGIGFGETMLTPTFNGMSIESDSSYGAKLGIDQSAADRRHDVDASTQQHIRTRTNGLYESLIAIADHHAAIYQTRSP